MSRTILLRASLPILLPLTFWMPAAAACDPADGLCITHDGGRWVLIRPTDLGPLVLDAGAGPGFVPLANGDGTSFLNLRRATATATLGGQSQGTVLIDAAITLDADGRAVPPSTLLVSGEQLRATSVLVADREGRPVRLDSVAREGPPTSSDDTLRRIAGIPPEEWPLVEHLVSLDEASWDAVRWLASLPSTGARATIPGDPLLAPGGGGPVALPEGIPDILQDLLNRITGVRTVVNNVQSVLGTARPDIRGLVSGVDLAGLQRLMSEVRDVLQGALDIAQELRAGFDSFNVAAFRVDLKALLGDLGTAWVNSQKLGCFEWPELTIREWNFPLATRMIDLAPPVVLFGMSKMLEQIAPDWRTSVRTLNDAIPPSLLEGVCTGPPGVGVVRIESSSVVCGALMPSGVEPALKGVKFLAKFVSTRFEIMSEWAKDDDVVGLGAVVVGGATIVKKVKYPAKPAYKQLSIMLDRLSSGAENLLDTRKDCLDDVKDEEAHEDEIEAMLRDCRPSHTIFLGATGSTIFPTLADVTVATQTFINRIRAAGYESEADRAQTEWNRAQNESTARARFDRLCVAYTALVPVTPTRRAPGRSSMR